MQYAVQQYKGESVITIWQGSFNAAGYGSGYNLLLDSQYKVGHSSMAAKAYVDSIATSQVIANV